MAVGIARTGHVTVWRAEAPPPTLYAGVTDQRLVKVPADCERTIKFMLAVEKAACCSSQGALKGTDLPKGPSRTKKHYGDRKDLSGVIRTNRFARFTRIG